MLMVLILLPVEFIIGAMIGFLLCDKEQGISVEEIKLGSIIFIVANAFVLYQNPEISTLAVAHLAISWFILSMGILVGELIRLKLVNNIISAIHKKDVQLAISNFIQVTTTLTYCSADKTKDIEQELGKVNSELDRLIGKANQMGDVSVSDKFSSIKELCNLFAKYSEYVCKQSDTDTKEKMMQSWLNIGNELSSLSWDTLNHAEENIKHQLRRGLGVNFLAYRR